MNDVVQQSGGALASSELFKRLDHGEIFRPGTWLRENVRAAGYDLRIADDFLIVPDIDNPRGRRYNRGKKRTEPIILRPGDVAFASTMERICVPWDLTGNIGIKFGYARKGILVLTGLLVDPGFGMREIGELWLPKEDERLHFLLANVGPTDVVFEPGKAKIASIQFFKVYGHTQRNEVPSTVDMQNEFFDTNEPPKLGLSFFRDMSDMKSEVRDFRTRVDVVERGTTQVVMFGNYLLGVTFLVGLLTALLGLVSSDGLRSKFQAIVDALPQTWPASISLMGLCAAVLLLPYSFENFWKRKKLEKK